MRIIAGKNRGKKINLPKDKLTRPLRDVVKESIYNLLIHSNKLNFEIEKHNEILFLIVNYFQSIGQINKSYELIKNYELIGWQTKDIYQNTAVTLLYSIKLNQVVDEKIFKTPLQN